MGWMCCKVLYVLQADQSTSEKKEEEEEQEKQEKEDPLDKSVLDDFTEGMLTGKLGTIVSPHPSHL